ncbi:MAG: dihydrodipicolinate reductase [Planctomycetota bacterium]
MQKTRVLCLGLGPIGLRAAALAMRKDSLEIVAAVDIDPEKAGKELDLLLEREGLEGSSGIVVEADAADALARSGPQIVIHSTSSFLPEVLEQILMVLEAGANLISSTEELLWPRHRHPRLSDRLDEAARRSGVTVLGTGVNPGFVMDSLAAFATATCHAVDKVICRRVVDAGDRRMPFQEKIGAGMEEAGFRELAAAGRLGHVGLLESIALLGEACGFELDDVRQTTDPVLADRPLRTRHLSIQPGQVAGIHNRGSGSQGGTALIEMDLRMYVGAESPFDEVQILGEPRLQIRVPGGTSGDLATAAMLVNGIPGVVRASPGLKTMLELPLPTLIR